MTAAMVDPRSPGNVDKTTTAPADVADGVLRQVDPRFVKVQRITAWIVTAALSIGTATGLAIAFLVIGPPTWVLYLALAGWVLLTVFLGWIAEKHPRWEHHFRRYRLTSTGIEIRGGILWRQVTSVPRSRVQHIDVAQGPLMRRYELAQLIIHTAGTEHATVELNGLAHDTALGLRDFLIRGGDDHVV